MLSEFSLRHGEAVAIGVAIDTVYSSLALGLAEEHARRVLRSLRELGFTLDCPQLRDCDALFNGLEEFRQHLGGRLTLTMLTDIGKPVEVHEVNLELLRQAIEAVSHFQRTTASSASLA